MGCGISVLGDAQNPQDVAGPVQPAPAEPAVSRDWSRWTPEAPANSALTALL